MEDLGALTNEQLKERVTSLEGKAQELIAKLDNEPGAVEEIKKDLKSIQDSVTPLLTEQKDRLLHEEMKDLKAQVKPLQDALKDLREWNPGLVADATKGQESPYASGNFSFYQDVKLAGKGNQKALERLTEVKAMTEGTDANGGYLVTPEIANELISLRVANTVVRQLVPSVSVTSDTMQFISETGGLTAGWVAELAEKPKQDMTFGQFSVSVFTAAGLAVTSNQLLADAGRQSSGPNIGIDSLINRELARRLAILEEIALINGTGTGQPLGILNTGGVGTVALTPTTIPDLLDAITDAILKVQTDYLGNPSHILMHPRTWARIVKARESSAPSTYLIGAGSTAFGRRGNDPLPGNGAIPGGFAGDLFGYPVVLSSNVPTNLGAGTDESRVIVGDFSQGLILDRQGMTVDTSEHVFFTSNQTVFRAEMRMGATFARYPKAFSVVQGVGLKNG
jgi:HK97 family phage major capsid protein